MEKMTPRTVLRRYERARERRRPWESHWEEAYDFALPQRGGFVRENRPGAKRTDRLFDGTAPDAVDQLAASLLAQLTPPWSRWFGLTAGPELSSEERDLAAPTLDRMASLLQTHFDRSNFAVEIHQCYLDLITGGTASLLFETAGLADSSSFKFTAVPLSQLILEEGPDGKLDTTYRRSELTVEQIHHRFPSADLPETLSKKLKDEPDTRVHIIEAVLPERRGHYRYWALLEDESAGDGEPIVLQKARLTASPFINFRWLKAPGETYGRSPVIKALPDIKTANKVVELVLKNATIAVTGIWQADDDGVVNPATVKLVPGAIIPKAVGSRGLTPLEAPGRFDVSELMLEDLRARIRHALLVDRLGQLDSPRMTATEILERSAEMARLLGATYGRLQSELLTPLIERGLSILRRLGEVPDVVVDGRVVDIQYRSPLAQDQAKQDVQNIMMWLSILPSLGPEAQLVLNGGATARWIADALGVPTEMLRALPEHAASGPGTAGDPLGSLLGGQDPSALLGQVAATLGIDAGNVPSTDAGESPLGLDAALAETLGAGVPPNIEEVPNV